MPKLFKCFIYIVLFVFFVLLLNKNVPSLTIKQRPPAPNFKKIRILLDMGNKKFNIVYNSNSPVQVTVDKELIFNIANRNFTVSNKGNRLQIGNITIKGKQAEFLLLNPDDFFIYKGKKFRRAIKAYIDSSKKVYLTHELPLELYISQVVAGEMAVNASEEALKAQAIASRTYCCYNMLERRLLPYDLTLESQAYKNVPNILQAVKETYGKVLTLNGRIIPAFFHTNCGGFTEYSVNVWRTYYHYSKIIECPYCKKSKHFSWKVKISYAEIKRSLKKGGYKISNIRSIYTYSVNPKTHRTTQIIIKTAVKDLILSANTFRLLIGPKKIKSTFFSITNNTNYAEFSGRGYGHGVGMCQDGAQEMAKQGFSAEDILLFYFPDTKITTIY